MDNWIPFADGEYLVDRACLVSASQTAVALERVVVEVYSDRQGRGQLKGTGRVRNILIVELLEDNDELDLLLDFFNDSKRGIMR